MGGMVQSAMRGLLGLILVVTLLGSPILALSDDEGEHDRDHDHDFARELYEHGEIRALRDVFRSMRKHVRGDIISVELVQISGAWFYRFQVVAPDGIRSTIDVTAAPMPLPKREDD